MTFYIQWFTHELLAAPDTTTRYMSIALFLLRKWMSMPLVIPSFSPGSLLFRWLSLPASPCRPAFLHRISAPCRVLSATAHVARHCQEQRSCFLGRRVGEMGKVADQEYCDGRANIAEFSRPAQMRQLVVVSAYTNQNSDKSFSTLRHVCFYAARSGDALAKKQTTLRQTSTGRSLGQRRHRMTSLCGRAAKYDKQFAGHQGTLPSYDSPPFSPRSHNGGSPRRPSRYLSAIASTLPEVSRAAYMKPSAA
ncbi:hypothetical protein DM02DRAFT_149498 [Periconia macrospinosa]|uniref:Uncharacterized protein n=1 Tax=Periconia macrospinosa TaxID=97972 RepID=A0A2V1DE68_9PLEO|nr:hypothetical protein DM02DRAFT_149498 [Periconia macrospinosa]